MESIPIILIALMNLLEEKLDLKEILGINIDQKDSSKYLQNNDKAIPKSISNIQMCILLQYYILCHNEVYENVQESNAKKLKKFYDSQLLDILQGKMGILNQIQSIFSKFDPKEIPQIFDLVNFLSILLEWDVNQITSKILEIFNLIAGIPDIRIEILLNLASVCYSYYDKFIKNASKYDNASLVTNSTLMFHLFYKIIIKLCDFIQNIDENSSPLLEEYSAANLKNQINFFFSIYLTNVETNRSDLGPISQKFLISTFEQILISSKTKPNPRIIHQLVCNQVESLFGLILDSTVNNDTRNKLMYIIISILGLGKQYEVAGLDSISKDVYTYYISFLFGYKEFLVYLRNEWKVNKNIDFNIVQIILAINLTIIYQLIIRPELNNEDYEFVVENFKFLAVILVESPNTQKLTFVLSYVIMYLLLWEKINQNSNSLTIINQLMNYVMSQLNPSDLKIMLSQLPQHHQAILMKTFPQILDILNADAKKQQEILAVKTTTAQVSSQEKPAIMLKKFGKK